MYTNIAVEEDTDLEVNDKVDVQYEKEGGTYYPGRISKINEDNTYDISYRDGDNEVSVPLNRIIKDKDLVPTSVTQGDYVDVRWPDNNGPYYPAKIDIVVDPDYWQTFNQAKRFYVFYHELGHDIFNLNHGNGGKMMFNYADRDITWDDFLEDRESMFERVLANFLL